MDEAWEHLSQDTPGAYPDAIGDYVCDPDFAKVGGFGIVFRARHVQPPHGIFAVKFLKADLAKIGAVRRRFIEEGQILRQLNHENCIRIYDADEQEGKPYIVMDFVDGKNAREMMPRGGMHYRTAASIVAQAARGLHHAHTRDTPIIHRDVKPSNILYDPSTGRAVVTDFGLAKRLFDPDRTVHGATVTPPTSFGGNIPGTVFYMPPEYIEPPEHSCVIGPRADIYSLGATLYELLAGRTPFPRDGVVNFGSRWRAIAEIRGGKTPRPLPSHVPEAIRRICARAMHRDPMARHASAGELAEALDAALGPVALARRPIFGRWMPVAIGLAAAATATVATVRSGLVERVRTTTAPKPAATIAPEPTRASGGGEAPTAAEMEMQALDAYDEAKHPGETIDGRFDHAGRLFDQMRGRWPQCVRGRISYLNCLQDFCRRGPPARRDAAATTGLAVLAELGKVRLDSSDAQEINVYRSYFSVYQDGVR